MLSPVFDRFVAKSPISVIARALFEHVLCPQELDALFERCAEQQQTRELLFSTTADLLIQAVCGIRKSVHAAFQATEDIAVLITSVSNKLTGVSAGVSAALVRFCGDRLTPIIAALGAAPEWLSGCRARLLDGNHLAATEHRLVETRWQAAGPLPGFCLVTLDAATGLAEDVFPCEDGHAQERALLGDVLEAVRKRDLWLADRNFCVARFLTVRASRSGRSAATLRSFTRFSTVSVPLACTSWPLGLAALLIGFSFSRSGTHHCAKE